MRTDPALVNAVIDVISASEQEESMAPLDTSRRSRPELVRFANRWLWRCVSRERSPQREGGDPEHSPLRAPWLCPRFWNHLRTITGGNWKDAFKSLAHRIRLMPAAPEAMKVVDRADGAARTLRPADIAVLCRSESVIAKT